MAKNVIKIEKYKEVYKCLLCGAVIYGNERGKSAVDGRPGFRLHGCENGNFGIGMLVGYEKVDGKA